MGCYSRLDGWRYACQGSEWVLLELRASNCSYCDLFSHLYTSDAAQDAQTQGVPTTQSSTRHVALGPCESGCADDTANSELACIDM